MTLLHVSFHWLKRLNMGPLPIVHRPTAKELSVRAVLLPLPCNLLAHRPSQMFPPKFAIAILNLFLKEMVRTSARPTDNAKYNSHFPH